MFFRLSYQSFLSYSSTFCIPPLFIQQTWFARLLCWLFAYCSSAPFPPFLILLESQQDESLQTTFLDSLVSWCQSGSATGKRWQEFGRGKEEEACPSPSPAARDAPPRVQQGEMGSCSGNAILTADAAPPVGLAQGYAPGSLFRWFQQRQSSNEQRLLASAWGPQQLWSLGSPLCTVSPTPAFFQSLKL